MTEAITAEIVAQEYHKELTEIIRIAAYGEELRGLDLRYYDTVSKLYRNINPEVLKAVEEKYPHLKHIPFRSKDVISLLNRDQVQ